MKTIMISLKNRPLIIKTLEWSLLESHPNYELFETVADLFDDIESIIRLRSLAPIDSTVLSILAQKVDTSSSFALMCAPFLQ